MKYKKQLILHVGLPKTGSSALQAYLFQNQKKLFEKGINYPLEFGNDNKHKHQSLVKGLLHKNHSGLKMFLENNKSSKLILSTEGLTNHLYDFSDESLKIFRQLTNEYEVHVFIVIREKENWIKSYYSQSVLNPKIRLDINATTMKLEEFSRHERILKLTNSNNLIADVKKAYGAQNIIIGNYSSNWFRTFCDSYQVPIFKNGLNNRINVSPEPWTIEIMRQINLNLLPEIKRKYWKAIIQQYTQSQHTLLKLSVGEIKLISNKAKDIRILDKLYAVEKGYFKLKNSHIQEFKKFVLNNG